MNAREFLREVQRQYDEFKQQAGNAPHPILKNFYADALAQIEKTVENARRFAESNPDREVSPEMAEGIVATARIIEMSHALMAKIPMNINPFVPTPGDRSILVYIELPGLKLGSWGGVLGQTIRAAIQAPLKKSGLLQDSAIPISCVGFDDFFFCSMVVTDQAQAVSIVKAELEQMALLPFCQIGHLDDANGVFRTFYANRTLRPFEDCLKRVVENYQKVGIIPSSLPPGRI